MDNARGVAVLVEGGSMLASGGRFVIMGTKAEQIECVN